MPARQATPGPSAGIILQQQETNTRKRSISEPDNEANNTRGKKPKQDDENAVKDKVKKPRTKKKKRKQSITTTHMSPRSNSRSASATRQKPGSSLLDAQSSVPPDSQTVEDSGTEMRAVEDAAPDVPRADKGKAKSEESFEDPQPTERSHEVSTSIESPQSKIARLTEELETTTTLLQRHQAHLSQIHQSLTCQICLDLLHKPFALAPCGHVVCHGCLVRWFTAPADEAGEILPIHKRKMCPICRSVITERPAEVWTVKGMVGGLVRSALMELPAPPPTSTADDAPTQAIDGNPDPWRNIFRPVRRRHSTPFVLPPLEEQAGDGGGGLENMGMYDAEDGGIYRCIECMNEIWDGVCTGCERQYPGHRVEDDGDDLDLSGDDDDEVLADVRRRDRRLLRDLVGMFADRRNLDPEEFGAWEDESLDDDEEEQEPIMDNIPWEEEARYRQMGMAHALDGLAPIFGPPPVLGGMHGMFADFTDDEEGGIATIEEAHDEGGGVDDRDDGYESSFIDDDSGPRIEEVIELSDSEDDGGGASTRQSTRTGQRRVVDVSDDSDPHDISLFEDDDEDDSTRNMVERIVRNMAERSARNMDDFRTRALLDVGDERSSSASPDVRMAGRRGNAGLVVIDSDDVIDSDEEPQVRRSGRNRGRS